MERSRQKGRWVTGGGRGARGHAGVVPRLAAPGGRRWWGLLLGAVLGAATRAAAEPARAGPIAAVGQQAIGPGRLRVTVEYDRSAGGARPGPGHTIVGELLDRLGRPVDSAAAPVREGGEPGELHLGTGLAGEWGLAVMIVGPEGLVEDEWQGRAELPAIPDLDWSVSPGLELETREGRLRAELGVSVRRAAGLAEAGLPIALEWWLVDGVRGEQVLGSGELGLTSSQQAIEQAAWVAPFYGPALFRMVVKGPTRAAVWAERELAMTDVRLAGGALRVNGDPFILKAVWLDRVSESEAEWREQVRRTRELGANAVWGEPVQPWHLRTACEQGLMWVVAMDGEVAGATQESAPAERDDQLRDKLRAYRAASGILAWGCGGPGRPPAPELPARARAVAAAEDGRRRPCLVADELAPETVCWGRLSELLADQSEPRPTLDPARVFRRQTMDVHAQLRAVSADGRTVRIALRNRRPYPLQRVALTARIPGQERELPLAEPLPAGATSTLEVACAYDVRGKALELRIAHESHCGLADTYTVLCAVPRR